MLARMRNILRINWRRMYSSTMAALPVVGAAEQTRLSWAKPIKSYAAVPNPYKDFFEPYRAEGRAFPYAVLTPSHESFIHQTTEKLICAVGRDIYVLERSGNTFEMQCYPLEGISYVEFRTILLDSRIKITGVTRQGITTSSTLRFNSVTDYLLTPVVERIRLATMGSPGAAGSSETEKFDHLVRRNYKFMNYARRSLLAGEKVLQTIFQPEIRTGVFTMLGQTYYRTISPAHLCILTDRELITIREDERLGREGRYGGIWDYISLAKIASLSLKRLDGGLLGLSIELSGSARLEYTFQASAEREINQLLDRFRELTT